ncbi:mitotic spindle assembly checkpoint protein MAD1 [Euwallacea similis]|uniref:mitotic spindle assembly checkpoint protein MAD1 n=1 Tax=Euwallacea similis TaxID=1736056 RepID=UPI00344FC371
MSEVPSVINKTIIRMVQDLKEIGCPDKTNDFTRPFKRSFSSNSESSLEEHTPVKRFKAQNSFNLSYVGSPREINRLRADLLEARNTIIHLEGRVQHMHGVQKEMRLMFDNESEHLKRQHDYDRKTIEELEMQLQTVRKRETGLKVQVSELKNKYDKLKTGTEKKIFVLEKEVADLQDQSQTSSSDGNMEVYRLKQNIAELETMLEAVQEDAAAQKKLASELTKQLSEKSTSEIELEQKKVELQKARNQIRQLENAKEEYLEFQQQSKTQAHKLAHYADLEKENFQLKEDFNRLKVELKNKLLLEEEVLHLKTRLVKHKDLEKKVADLQAQFDQTQMYLGEWRAVARGFCETTESDAVLPHLLRTAIEKLQQQELTLTAEKVEYESQMRSAQHDAKVASTELEKIQKLLTSFKSTSDQKQTLIHRMQKKLLLVSRERDSYRLQLDSYEKDLTMVNNTTANFNTNIIQSQKERIDNLEKVVEGYRDLVTKLENELLEAQPQLHQEAVPVRQEQIARLQDDVAKLREENERLRQQRDRLEIQLEEFTRGQDTLMGGQVFHLNANPLNDCLAQRHEKLEELQEENLKLKNKLKKMEEGIETSRLADLSICPKEVAALKEQIKNNEKKTQRMKDNFKSLYQELRDMIYMLFGYKLDKPSNSVKKYSLTSMYAESEQDVLCFEVDEDGSLNLLENDFSANLEAMIQLHLGHQKSIPVFLSAITLDLFNHMTKSY